MTPPLFHPILGVFPLDQIADVGVNVLYRQVIIFEVLVVQPVRKHT